VSAAGARWTEGVAPLAARWQSLDKREKLLVAIAAWIVGIALLWFVAIAPAWRTVARAPARLDQLDAQLLQMQRLAGEARALRTAPAVGSAQAQAALKAACDSLGAAARLVMAGDRATVTFTNVNSGQLRQWLSEVRGAARARPIEANLTRGTQGFSGSIVVALPGGAS
jgi:general secretion pathway protein M